MNSVPARFFDVAARFPVRTAIVAPRHPDVTYEVLAGRVHGLRAWLKGVGVRHGDVVCLAIDEPGELAAAMLAVLAEGAIYTVLDVKLPVARLEFVVRDCGTRWILADGEGGVLASQVAAVAGGVTVLTVPDEASGEAPDLRPPVESDLAYISYTSGSTGTPKGVVFLHKNILHEVAVHTETLGLTEEDRFTWLYPASTVGCARDFYGALLNGAAIAFFPFRQLGMAALRDWIREQRLTQFHSVPPIFRELMGVMEPGGVFQDLRTVFLAGDRVAWSDVELQARHTAPSCRFYTGLGASETSSLYAHWLVDASGIADRTILPSGYAVSDTKIRLLDEAGREVLAGDIGQIWVQSAFLAAGYWNRPDLTESHFLPAPGNSGERIYSPGDFGSFDAGGRLIYRGRRDQQIKVLGQRIDLSEIDLALRSLPGAREVAVRVFDGPSHAPQVIGYILWAGMPMPEPEAKLRLAEKLPAAAIPARLIGVSQFPVSANGKIDYKQLPLPEPDLSSQGVRWKPTSEREERLAALWLSLFPHWTPEKVAMSFAELGGDSLKAVELNIQLRSCLGIAISGEEFTRGISLQSITCKLAVHAAPLTHKTCTIEWETEVKYRERLSAGVHAWRLPDKAQFIAGDLGARLLGKESGSPLVWLPLMKEDLDLAIEASESQTVYLLQPGVFSLPKDRQSLAPWFRDLCRILEAEGVRTIRCGGFCAGGLAAVLFAKEFRARGGVVERLVVIDAYGSEWARWLNRRIFGSLRLRSRLKRWRARLAGAAVSEKSPGVIQKHSPIDFDREPYDGPAILAMASENHMRQWIAPRWGWTHPTHRGWTVLELPGTHLGIFSSPARQQMLELLSSRKIAPNFFSEPTR